MIQTLEVISVNLWQILISLANLLLIFLILKKFLWKPVKKVMDERKAMVDKQFADAAAAQEQAEADKAQWAAKLATADDEAKARIAAADETSRHHGDRLVADAKDKADSILRMAEAEAVLERQKAQAGIKREIAAVSAELAEKLLEREVNTADHAKMIESFLDEVGDAE
jgi:F-type H+-transporting ATPase subunit b